MKPLISIILCTFQGEKFLKPQLNSLLQQTYTNFEILIFDDASSDNTTKIIKNYVLRHTNICLHINNQRLGFIKNFEQAIAYCLNQDRSNYIALCDQDDLWHLNKLSHSIQTLQILEQHHPKSAALVHCDLKLIDSKNREISSSFFKNKNLSFPDKKSLNTLFGYNGVMGNTLLINRYLAEISLPFPPQLKYHDYWISIINELFGIRKTIYQPLIDYRIHRENTSNNRQAKKSNWRMLYQKIIQRNLLIPFRGDQREYIIDYLLKNFSNLATNEYLLLIKYQRYLNADMNRIEALLFLFQENFLKRGWKHKLSVTFRILVSRSYYSK